MKPRITLTPAMMRTRYHERSGSPSKPAVPGKCPPLGPFEPGDVDAEWLAHVQAGRITVT